MIPPSNLYKGSMADVRFPQHAGRLAAAVARFLLLSVGIPVLFALAAGIPVSFVLALVFSTLVIEYGAAPVGIGLGLSPLYVLFALVCVALAVTLFLFDIIDTLSESSDRVRRFLERSAEKGRRSRLLSKYGICGLAPLVITLGFYACPPVSCILGWDRTRSILVIMAGYTGIAIATILVTTGIFNIILR